jgi:hypothetical protein
MSKLPFDFTQGSELVELQGFDLRAEAHPLSLSFERRVRERLLKDTTCAIYIDDLKPA